MRNEEGYCNVRIKKQFLIDGNYYAGVCRHSRVARWNSEEGKFYYWRNKCGKDFIEDINCAEDDDIYDVFFPLVDLGAEAVIKPIIFLGENNDI